MHYVNENDILYIKKELFLKVFVFFVLMLKHGFLYLSLWIDEKLVINEF